jgi:hypothetical protein
MSPPCFFYKVYGLHVCSDRPVLEFEPLIAGDRVDIRLRWQDMDAQPVYKEKDWHFDVGPSQATLCFKGVGVFLIPDTSTILVKIEYGADARMVERYLSGVVFAVLLHLRGLVIYHAGSVAINENEAIAFIGESGAGKSTLAALLHLRGFSCITDDVSALKVDSHRIAIIPGFPRLKIDQDLALQHSIPADRLCPVHSSEEQIYLSLFRGFPARPLTLRALFFLDRAPQVTLQRITARQAMIQTVRFTLPSRLLQMTGSREHFRRCSMIAGSVPAYALARTDDITCREQLADMVVREVCHGEDHSKPLWPEGKIPAI